MINYRLKKKKIFVSKYRSMDFCGKFSVHNILDCYGNVVGQILKNYFGLFLRLRCFFSISKLEFSTGYSISEPIFLIKTFEPKFYQSVVLVFGNVFDRF